MKKNNITQYILYFLSFLIAYPVGFVILMFIGFGTDSPYDPLISEHMANVLMYITYTILTFVTPFILNVIFKRIMNFKKNTKYAWMIFASHFLLIPTPIIILWIYMTSTLKAM